MVTTGHANGSEKTLLTGRCDIHGGDVRGMGRCDSCQYTMRSNFFFWGGGGGGSVGVLEKRC